MLTMTRRWLRFGLKLQSRPHAWKVRSGRRANRRLPDWLTWNRRFEALESRCLLASVKFAVVGDYGADNTSEGDVADEIKSWNPEFITTLGDNNYSDGAASTIDANIGKYYHDYIYPYKGTYGAGSPNSTNRFFPTLGNHDWHATGAKPYLDYFTLPGNERYYTFTKGPVQFFMLDSDPNEPDGRSPTSTQGTWFHSAISASTAPWKLVMFHHSPYSSGTHGSNEAMQWPFKEWGASAVLTGHNHIYERIVVDGFTYFTNGVGGDDVTTMGTAVPGTQFRDNSDFGAMRVNADDTHITFEFITRAGLVLDTYSMSKTTTLPSVSITASDASAAEPTNNGAFSVTRTGSTASSLAVSYTIGGTAANGADYNLLAGTVTIAAGQASASIPVTTKDDTLSEGPESVIVTITDTSTYNLGTSSSATVTIAGNEPASGSSLEVRVSASADDVEESSSGSMNLVSADLELVNDGNNQTVGMRFRNLTIPKGATITNAYMQFVTDYSSTGAASLAVRGQDIDNAPAFTSSADNVSARTKTSASVAWSPPDWPTADEAGAAQRTPNLKSIVQEIVDRSGWASGNSLVLIVTGTGVRRASAYDRAAADAPLLHVEYATQVQNQSPVVNAGADQSATFSSPSTSVVLNGTVTDDGLPSPPNLTLQWTKVSGPGTVAFSSATIARPTASFSAAGSYVLRLTATDGSIARSDDVTITLTQATSQTFEARTITGDDDAEETTGTSGRMYTTEVALDLGAYIVGLRYQGVNIPKGATITKAYLQFRAEKAGTAATSVTIRAQAIDNAPTFNTTPFNISSRATTTASAAWTIPSWTAGTTGSAQRSTDLSAVIQEIVNRSGWAANKALALIITGTGERAATSFQGTPAVSPLLHVEYTTAAQSQTAEFMMPGDWTSADTSIAASSMTPSTNAARSAAVLPASPALLSALGPIVITPASRMTAGRRVMGPIATSSQFDQALDEVFRRLGRA